MTDMTLGKLGIMKCELCGEPGSIHFTAGRLATSVLCDKHDWPTCRNYMREKWKKIEQECEDQQNEG